MQYVVEKVELSADKERLIFHTKSVTNCKRLWSQLYGQLLDVTEGRKSVPYDIQEDIPSGTALEIEIDTDQIVKVLTYLEVESKFNNFLLSGTTEQVRKLIELDDSTSQDSNEQENIFKLK